MSRPRNLVIAQSGGPTPVINNSLRGVVEAARDLDAIGTVYGARHGIEGVLKEELLDLSAQPQEEIDLLRVSPTAGAIGTCRYKLKPERTEDFERTIEVFRAHDVGYFLYNGGNDSMDTAHRVAEMARDRGLDLIAVGVPKTIDNDVGDSEFKQVDHTPGYGSTAKYWLHMVQNADQENRGSCPADPVLVMQAMGRQIGFIPAAARLADPGRELPLLIYLAERPCSLEQLADQVNDELRRAGRCVVVISEGFFDFADLAEKHPDDVFLKAVGELLLPDDFGHTMHGSLPTSAAQVAMYYLNKVGLAAKGNARANVSGTDQRHSMAYASAVDLDEAYKVGQLAAMLAARGEGGFMSTILREPGPLYQARYDKVPLVEVAGSDREFPQAWIAEDRPDVTDDFVSYARPLVGDDLVTLPLENARQRLARLEPIFADRKLPAYVPQGERNS